MDRSNGFLADVIILGGGLTAHLTGAALAHAGMRPLLLCRGDDYDEVVPGMAALPVQMLLRSADAHGADVARLYIAALQTQLQSLTSAPPPYVQRLDAFFYARTAAERPALQSLQTRLAPLGLSLCAAPDAGSCPFPVEDALRMPGQAWANVPRWVGALRGEIHRLGGRILRSRVTGIDGQQVFTERGRFSAPVILHTGGNPPGLRPPQLLLLESRLILRCTLHGPSLLEALQFPLNQDGLTLLPAPEGLQILWDAGRIGARRQQARLDQLEAVLHRRLPDWQAAAFRFSQQAFSLDGLPVIGVLPGTQQLFATGFPGVLGSMHAAQVVTRRILGRTAPEDRLYAPDRMLPEPPLRSLRRRIALVGRPSFLRHSPTCPHCGARLHYGALSRWECPGCGTIYGMFGTPLWGPSTAVARVSPRQRPDL